MLISQVGSLRIYKKHGSISVGKKTYCWPNIKISCEGTPQHPANLQIGERVQIGNDTQIHCGLSLTIEDDVMISWGCSIMDRDFHAVDGKEEKRAPTFIGKGSWIGCYSIILKGVRVGQGAVIGAGTVVTSDVPDYCVAAGNPARIIKTRGQLEE